jgi:hypothetical protein
MRIQHIVLFYLLALVHVWAYFYFLTWGKLEWVVCLFVWGLATMFGMGLQSMRSMARGRIGASFRTHQFTDQAETEAFHISAQYLSFGLPIPFLWANGYLHGSVLILVFGLYYLAIPTVVGIYGVGGKLVADTGYDIAKNFGATENTAKEIGFVAGRVAQIAVSVGVADGLLDGGGGDFQADPLLEQSVLADDGSLIGVELSSFNEAIPELTGDGYGPLDETYGLPSEVDGDLRTAHYVEGYFREDGTYIEGHWKGEKG